MYSRHNEGVVPQFVPGKDYEKQPLGNADEQISEAMKVAKELNARPEVGLSERIARMDSMNVATATNFLDGLSQHELEKYLTAERMSKGRTSILGRYGW